MPGKASHSDTLGSADILKEEFEYIAQTAVQADEDHARVSSFYLVAVGSLLAALLSTQLLDKSLDPIFVARAFSGLFLVLTVLGTLTILQLARLRAAWHESMQAMNQLKDYWILQSRDKNLRKAFRWDARTLPRKYRMNSVSFFQTAEVALLSSITFGAAVFFFQKGISYNCPSCNWAYTVAFGILAFLLQLSIYKLELSK